MFSKTNVPVFPFFYFGNYKNTFKDGKVCLEIRSNPNTAQNTSLGSL